MQKCLKDLASRKTQRHLTGSTELEPGQAGKDVSVSYFEARATLQLTSAGEYLSRLWLSFSNKRLARQSSFQLDGLTFSYFRSNEARFG